MRRETFPASGPIRLDLHVDAGEIVVEAGHVAETAVELEPLGGEESRSAVEEARVDTQLDVSEDEWIEGHGLSSPFQLRA